MVFKSEAVRERLKRLEEVIARLSAYRGTTSEEFLDDVERQWVVERGFILAAECVADVAGHILSGKFKVQPVDQEDAVRGLGNQRVISDLWQRGSEVSAAFATYWCTSTCGSTRRVYTSTLKTSSAPSNSLSPR